ncbi:MAG: DsbA family protein [Acidimicrobiales bacterium]|jgi:2-hydroxychromene-2-carboxylate isomerase
MAEQIDFHFDPMCPWAYQASLWIREVRDRVGLDIRWRFFSLEEINLEPGRKHPWERPWSYGWSQMRIGALLRRESQEAIDRWYQAVGQAFFVEGRPTHDPAVHRQVLAEAGFDPSVLDAAIDDPTTSEEVRADHDELVGRHGGFGVPTIVFADGNAVFGPVILPPPTGDAAVRLWELVVAANEFPTLYELRHPKRPEDLRAIAGAFAPYLQARAWRTVERPAP